MAGVMAACTGDDPVIPRGVAGEGGADAPAGTDGPTGGDAGAGADAGADAAESGCPPKGAASARAFVDPTAGADDADHGTAYGACAYKTLAFALENATGEIALQTATYTPVGVDGGAAAAFRLQGAQKLLCKHQTAGRARLSGKGVFGTVQTVVAMTGGDNALIDCVVDGQGPTVPGYCIDVTASGTAAAPHRVKNTEITNCGNGSAINVEQDISYVVLEGSNIHDHGGTGIFWIGNTAGGDMTNNVFTNNGTDVQCQTANPGLTGTGNTKGGGGNIATCVGCSKCFFP